MSQALAGRARLAATLCAFSWLLGKLSSPRRYATHSLVATDLVHFTLSVYNVQIALGNKISLFFVPRGKISNPDRAFNAEFKYVSSFSPSPTVFFVTAERSVKKCVFLHISLGNKISLFFVPRGKISNPNGAFNTEFKYVSSFSPSPTVFL